MLHTMPPLPPLQVLGLRAAGIHAAALTSLTTKEEATAINAQLDDPNSGARARGG